MTKTLDKVTFRHRRADGSGGEIEIEVREGDSITVEREFKGGHRDERQLYPQSTGYQPVKPVWKPKNEN